MNIPTPRTDVQNYSPLVDGGDSVSRDFARMLEADLYIKDAAIKDLVEALAGTKRKLAIEQELHAVAAKGLDEMRMKYLGAMKRKGAK